MDYQEAILSLKFLKDELEEGNEYIFTTTDEPQAIDVAISAMNEIQEYHQLGTLEEMKILKETHLTGIELSGLYCALKKLNEYEKLGTLEEVRDAVEKQKAKKPKIKKNKHSDAYLCPKCGSRIISKDETGWFAGENYYYCCFCGQHIDWSEQ